MAKISNIVEVLAALLLLLLALAFVIVVIVESACDGLFCANFEQTYSADSPKCRQTGRNYLNFAILGKDHEDIGRFLQQS